MSGERGNGSRRPVEIMREINATRDEMDETLSAIEHRLTPGQLVDQGLDYLKNSGAREYASNLGASLKTHPLPATLTGIGLAWLMAVGNRPAQSYESSGPSIGERMQSTRETVGSKVQSAKDSLYSAKDSISSGMQSTRESWDSIVQDNPLVLGAVGLALGAVVAALAPRTRTEDQLMGQARDDLVDKAKQAGAQKMEQVKEQARQTVGEIKDAATDATTKATQSKFSPSGTA